MKLEVRMNTQIPARFPTLGALLAALQEWTQEGSYPAVIEGARPVFGAGSITLRSPVDGLCLGEVGVANAAQTSAAIANAQETWQRWRMLPAPQRGEFVRLLGNQFRIHKDALARLITLETGKPLRESLGEVQEVIDICDFAQGLSRQLYGLTMATERPLHRMMEQWHPLGVVGVITAFNFPMAVWAWNAMIAWVCGNVVVWKPSEKTPLCALACQRLVHQTLHEWGKAEEFLGLSIVVNGGAQVGQCLAEDRRVALVSATGSTHMGRQVAVTVAERLGRTLLELGGNNAVIVTPSADLKLALKAVAFSALGTSGQRCTTLRRLFLHESVADAFTQSLKSAYASVVVGDPFDDAVLCGPLIDEDAAYAMERALKIAVDQGGRIIFGGDRLAVGGKGSAYMRPALVEIDLAAAIVQQETFAPILYVGRYRNYDAAIAAHNAVRQGLSSALFSNDLKEAEQFLSASGSDCGIVNINIGTSGAEIGGAFGGEKDTGGGRESGSDAWKAYMRRATNTINYGESIPLAQGIQFDLPP
ncbi:Aldehyde dehydrogenase [gamma proteobacterium HdN1]|nr:Aldehyde dehydrogenase [gamma proteobacterium HdN1]